MKQYHKCFEDIVSRYAYITVYVYVIFVSCCFIGQLSVIVAKAITAINEVFELNSMLWL